MPCSHPGGNKVAKRRLRDTQVESAQVICWWPVAYDAHFFSLCSILFLLWLNNITLYNYPASLIHSSVDKHLECFHLLAFVNSVVLNIQQHVFSSVPVFSSLGVFIYLAVESLTHTVILCLTFWGNTELFSKVAAAFYILIRNMWRFLFPHILTNS